MDGMSDVIQFDAGEFVHLGLGATTVPLPVHTGSMDWYVSYGEAHGGDGDEGRLVSLHTFTEAWDTWEVHPNGTELVLCVGGTIELIQEIDGDHRRTRLTGGQAVVNDPGVWHTADVPDADDPPTVVFITSGRGTDVRGR